MTWLCALTGIAVAVSGLVLHLWVYEASEIHPDIGACLIALSILAMMLGGTTIILCFG